MGGEGEGGKGEGTWIFEVRVVRNTHTFQTIIFDDEMYFCHLGGRVGATHPETAI